MVNGIDYIADTNAVIYLLAGNVCMESFKDSSIALSVINEVKNRAICLRCGFGMKLPDAIVAATALVKHLPLIAADKGFARLPDLKLYLLKP